MTREEVSQKIQRAFDDPRIIQAALAKGVEDARRQYAQAGFPMASLKDNRVVWMDPVTLEEVERPSVFPAIPGSALN